MTLGKKNATSPFPRSALFFRNRMTRKLPVSHEHSSAGTVLPEREPRYGRAAVGVVVCFRARR